MAHFASSFGVRLSASVLCPWMGGLSRQPSRTPRRVREQRAYRLAIAGGSAGVAAVVTAILAIVGIGSLGIPLILAIVAAVCFFLFKRTVGG